MNAVQTPKKAKRKTIETDLVLNVQGTDEEGTPEETGVESEGPWVRVRVPRKKYPETRQAVLDEVDKHYHGVVKKFEELRVPPKALHVNKAFRDWFPNVMVWGDKPHVNVLYRYEDKSNLPSFYFEY